MSEELKILGLALDTGGTVQPSEVIRACLQKIGGEAQLAQSALNTLGASAVKSAQAQAGLAPVLGIQTTAMSAFGHAAYEVAEAQHAVSAASKTAASDSLLWGAAFAAGASLAAVGIHKIIHESIEAQNAQAQLDSALQTSGSTSGKTATQIEALASRIQKFSTFSDDAAKRSAALLLVFDKVRGSNFDRALLSATDLAAAMGTDLPTAAGMLGRALQDPEHGLRQLQMSLRLFDDDQLKSIKRMMDLGHAAEAQGVILDALESKVRGRAAAMQNTLGGALSHLKNAFGDLFEVTSKTSGPVIDFLNGVANALGKINPGAIARLAGAVAFTPQIAGQVAAGAFTGGQTDDQKFAEAQRARHAASVALLADRAQEKAAAEANAKALRDATSAEEAEVEKLRALNGAYGQTSDQLAILGIQQDARIEKLKIEAGDATDAVKKRLKELVDERAKELIKAIQLAQQQRELNAAREREIALLDLRNRVLKEEPQERADAAARQGASAWQSGKDAISGFHGNPADSIRQQMVEARKAAIEAATGMGKAIAEAIWDDRLFEYDAAKAGRDIGEALAAAIEQGAKKAVPNILADAVNDPQYQDFLHGRGPRSAFGTTPKPGGEEAAAHLEAAFTQAFQNIAARGKASFSDLFAFVGTLSGPGAIGTVANIGGLVFGALEGLAARDKAREEALRRAREAYEDSLDDWIKDIRRGTDEFADAVADAREKYLDLLKQRADIRSQEGAGGQVADALPGRAAADQEKLNRAYIAQLEAIDRLRAAKHKEIEDDLRVATLRAQGRTDEADALALSIEYERKRSEAIKAGAKDLLDDIDAWYAASQAAAEAAKAERELATTRRTQSLEAEYQRALGNDAAAREIEHQIRLGEAENDAQRTLIDLIFSLNEAAIAAEAAAQHIAAMKAAMQSIEDLEVDTLRALGKDAEADALALQHDYDRRRQAILDNKDIDDETRQAWLDALDKWFDAKSQQLTSRTNSTGASLNNGTADPGAHNTATSFSVFGGVSAVQGNALVSQTRTLAEIARSHYTEARIQTVLLRRIAGGGGPIGQLTDHLQNQDQSRLVD